MEEHIYPYIAGGRQHPLPYFSFYPRYIVKASEVFLWDDNGRAYIDLWMGYGTLILGYDNEYFIRELTKQLIDGYIYSAPSELEEYLYRLITKYTVNISDIKIKYGITGSQMVQTALDLARGMTKRNKIIVLGTYHGMNETLHYKGNIIRMEFNSDLNNLLKIIENNDVAAIIMEPVLTNKGIIIPSREYMGELRRIANENCILLISDEVVTGFRITSGFTIDKYFNVKADMIIGSKSLGNGIPFMLMLGSEEIMDYLSPRGSVFYGGTFFGNALSLRAAITVIQYLEMNNGFKQLEETTKIITDIVSENIKAVDEISMVWLPGVIWIYFGGSKLPQKPSEINEPLHTKRYIKFSKQCITEGLFVPSSPFEPLFISLAHRGLESEIGNKLAICINRAVQ